MTTPRVGEPGYNEYSLDGSGDPGLDESALAGAGEIPASGGPESDLLSAEPTVPVIDPVEHTRVVQENERLQQEALARSEQALVDTQRTRDAEITQAGDWWAIWAPVH